MNKISHYFCVFCDFKCEEYSNACNHYEQHMYVKGNCELCDFTDESNKLNLLRYNADSSDHLDQQCDHKLNIDSQWSHKKQETDAWIRYFLSYQKKLFRQTFTDLLLQNKVCVECVVCRYLLDNYKRNDGNMNLIQYVNDNQVEHCYAHLRYNTCTTKSKNITCFMRFEKIRKLELFIALNCDTFFTAGYVKYDNKYDSDSVINVYAFDSEQSNSISQLSVDESNTTISNESSYRHSCIQDTVQQSLEPIISRLSIAERKLESHSIPTDTIRAELENIKKEINIGSDSISLTNNEIVKQLTKIVDNTTKSEIEKIEYQSVPIGTISYFATITAPNGWLIANGQTVCRTEYANLFQIIGIKYDDKNNDRINGIFDNSYDLRYLFKESNYGRTTFKLPYLESKRGLSLACIKY